MSAAACRQWAAVNTIRGASTIPCRNRSPRRPASAPSPPGRRIEPRHATSDDGVGARRPEMSEKSVQVKNARNRRALMFRASASWRSRARRVSGTRRNIEAERSFGIQARRERLTLMARVSTIFSLMAVGALWLEPSAARAAEAAEAHVVSKPVCLPPSEAREEIKAHHLLEPFAVLNRRRRSSRRRRCQPNYAVWTRSSFMKSRCCTATGDSCMWS